MALLVGNATYTVNQESAGLVFRDLKNSILATVKWRGGFLFKQYIIFDSKGQQIGSIKERGAPLSNPLEFYQEGSDKPIGKILYGGPLQFGKITISDSTGNTIASIKTPTLGKFIVSNSKDQKIAEVSILPKGNIVKKAFEIISGNEGYTLNILDSKAIPALMLIQTIATLVLYNAGNART